MPDSSSILLAALVVAAAACSDSSGPGNGETRLAQARFSAADPPPAGVNYLAQVSAEQRTIAAAVLVRADPACNTIGAGIDLADTLLLVVETTVRAGCEPLAGGTLIEALIVGVPEDPVPFRIEWWHGEVVDTVYSEAAGGG